VKGYLQRLASHARNPGGTLRPLAGSIYAGPQSRSASAHSGLEEEIVTTSVARRQESAFTPESVVRQDRTSTSAPDPVGSTREGALQSKLGVLQRDRVEPTARQPVRAPQSMDWPESGSKTFQLRSRDPSEDFASERIVSAARAADKMRPRAESGTSLPAASSGANGREPQVKLARQAANADADVGSQLVPVPGRDTRTASAADLPLRNRGTERARTVAGRQPDEIQIHIGRIEVTAARAVPVALPKPKPARKAPPLAEYLRGPAGGRR
jgi:hypothetical protein